MGLFRKKPKGEVSARIIKRTSKGTRVKEATLVLEKRQIIIWNIALDNFETIQIELRK